MRRSSIGTARVVVDSGEQTGADRPYDGWEGARPPAAHPARRRRADHPDAAVLSPAQGGLRGRAGVRRPGGARALQRADLRPGRARRDDAARRRPRGLPAPAGQEHGPDHHADRQGRGDRQGPRPRDRRRRLHHQAVLAAGVPQPRQGRAAARRDVPLSRDRRDRGAARGARAARRLLQAQRARARRGRHDDVRRVRDPARPGHQSRPGLHARHAPDAHLGRQRLSRPAHDRRAHPSPAREARDRRQGPGVPLHRARRRLPVPRHGQVTHTHMRSLATRLTLLFLVIALAAVTVVYAYVVPPLQSSLRDEKLDALNHGPQRYTRPIEQGLGAGASVKTLNRLVRGAADRAYARVTLLGVTRGTEGVQTYVRSDSTAANDISDLQFAVATEAARTGSPQQGTEASERGRVGEAATALFFTDTRTGRRAVGSVVVYSSPVDDVSGSVALIRRRIIVAGVLAFLLALVAGGFAASRITRRVQRIQRVADRVARGDFSARFPVDRQDELGELARSLDNMQRQLAELDSARKRFIAVASHELRTPIFSLGGFLELLAEEDLDEEERARFLQQLREQVDRLGKLATDLLDLSTLEAGSLELRPEPVDLRMLARAVSDEFAPALATHDSQIELRLPRRPVAAVCDPERVSQVMRILIDNALTHTPAGTDMVVTASSRDGHVRLGVGDFGPGIHRSMLPRIFEPFITSDDAQGSGLGLAIAHELAERMEGELRVESQPGRTTFTLQLPDEAVS